MAGTNNGLGLVDCTAVRMNPAAFAAPPASACALGAEGSQGPDRIARNIYDNAGQVRRVVRAYATPLKQDYASIRVSTEARLGAR